MKPSPGERGTDRRVWVRFLQSHPRSRRGWGKVEIRRGVPDFQAHWESSFFEFFQVASFPPPAALRRAGLHAAG
jgi:hypothetical protein